MVLAQHPLIHDDGSQRPQWRALQAFHGPLHAPLQDLVAQPMDRRDGDANAPCGGQALERSGGLSQSGPEGEAATRRARGWYDPDCGEAGTVRNRRHLYQQWTGTSAKTGR